MSASRYAKEAGLKSLAEASKMTGASVQTLNNYYHNKPDLFKAIIRGCVEIKRDSEK